MIAFYWWCFMKIDKKLIGIRIMTKRKECGLSQETLAEIIGYSKNHLSSVERGKYTPTTNFIIAICNALGETPDYYLIGTPTKKHNRSHKNSSTRKPRYSLGIDPMLYKQGNLQETSKPLKHLRFACLLYKRLFLLYKSFVYVKICVVIL